jgi:hypothetical protein
MCTVVDNDVGSYVAQGLADIVDVTHPVPLSLAAASISGDVIPFFNGSVFLEILLPDGSVVSPSSPGPLLIDEGGWSGEIQFPEGIAGPARLRVSDLVGNEGLSKPFDVMRPLGQHFADVVWDHVRGRFYATIGTEGFGGYSNQVVVIDPATAEVTQRLPLAQDPGQLAITSGSEFLYVVLNANGTIARIDPASMAVQSVFPVGTSSSGTLYAGDICTVTGQSDLLLVAQKRDASWGSHHAVALYENGVPRAETVPAPQGGGQIEPSAEPNVFYAHADNGLKKLLIGPSGVTETQANNALLNQYDLQIRSDGDYVLASSGVLVDGTQLSKLGAFPASGVACPHLAASRVFFVTSTTPWSGYNMIQAYDPLTFQSFLELTFSRDVSAPRTLIRWGTNGLALLADSELVLINSSRLVPSAAPADLAVTIAATPSPAMVGSPLAYSISLTNRGPNTAAPGFIQAALSEGQSVQSLLSTHGTPTKSGSIVRLDFGSVASGQAVNLLITAMPESAGALSCSVVASSESVDPNPTNNLAAISLVAGVQTALDEVNLVRLNANNIVYDASRGLIWATTPSAPGSSSSGHVVSIDPQTGMMSPALPLGGDPISDCIALSANGRYLYAGVRSASGMARLDLAANPITITNIFLGSDFGDPKDVEALAGDGASFIAVSSFRYEAFVFDGDVRRPISSGSSSVLQIEKTAESDAFVGFLSWSPSLSRMIVSSEGITVTQQTSQVLTGSSEIRGAGDLILSSAGKLVDANTLTLRGSFNWYGPPCLDELNQRGYIVTGDRLYSLNTTTLFSESSFELPETLATDTAQSCIRWGTDGFAVNTSSGSVYLGRWSAIPANPDSNSDGMADGWELFYFQTLEVDPLADLDQDGICNCIEFLYGTSPAQPSTSPLQISIVNSEGQSKLRLLFPRRLGLSPLPYYYESSTDLVDWTVPANLTETTVATDEIEGVPVEWVQVLLPAPTDTGFVRFTWGMGVTPRPPHRGAMQTW